VAAAVVSEAWGGRSSGHRCLPSRANHACGAPDPRLPRGLWLTGRACTRRTRRSACQPGRSCRGTSWRRGGRGRGGGGGGRQGEAALRRAWAAGFTACPVFLSLLRRPALVKCRSTPVNPPDHVLLLVVQAHGVRRAPRVGLRRREEADRAVESYPLLQPAAATALRELPWSPPSRHRPPTHLGLEDDHVLRGDLHRRAQLLLGLRFGGVLLRVVGVRGGRAGGHTGGGPGAGRHGRGRLRLQNVGRRLARPRHPSPPPHRAVGHDRDVGAVEQPLEQVGVGHRRALLGQGRVRAGAGGAARACCTRARAAASPVNTPGQTPVKPSPP
jgi:hypothetical protein